MKSKYIVRAFFNPKIKYMKKSIALSIFVFVISFAALSQNDRAFEKGTNLVNLGIGLGSVYWGAGYSNSGLPFSLNASYEHGVTDKLGIGYVAVGAQVGYATSQYAFGGSTEWKSTGILLAARGSFHFAIPAEIGKKLDPYAGVLIGYVITNYSYNNGYNTLGYGLPTGKAGGIAVGAFAGAHYLFSQHFGVFGELGYTSFSILSLGIALKF
jgi:hypothetical protein